MALGPQLPTYRSIVGVLEREHGAGAKLAGWTVARSALIAVPMRAVGVSWKQAFAGGLLASILISAFALSRARSAVTAVEYDRRRRW